MEENKVAQMTKHTDSSRSTDSGVSGNAPTGAGESRKCVNCGNPIVPALHGWMHRDELPRGTCFSPRSNDLDDLPEGFLGQRCGQCDSLFPHGNFKFCSGCGGGLCYSMGEPLPNRIQVTPGHYEPDPIEVLRCSYCKLFFSWPLAILDPNFCPSCGVRSEVYR